MRRLFLMGILLATSLGALSQKENTLIEPEFDSLGLKVSMKVELQDLEYLYSEISKQGILEEVTYATKYKMRLAPRTTKSTFARGTTKITLDLTGHQALALFNIAREDFWKFSVERLEEAIRATKNKPLIRSMENLLRADQQMILEKRQVGKKALMGTLY